MTLGPGDVPPVDPDLDGWVRRLLARARHRHDSARARDGAGIFPSLRPAERHFGREVSILHDFTPLILPWTHVAETRRHFGGFFARSLGLSDRAVAVSASTRCDASWLAALPVERIAVGNPGPSLCAREHACRQPVERKPRVLAVVSTLEPRKNGPFLFDWFLNSPVLEPGMELWWVGPRGWLCSDAGRPARVQSRRGRRIKFLGMIPDALLCRVYRQAALTVYPSLYEGFGFPVLDSLRHGTPVLCGYNSSLQEFAGPGVFYFDVHDPDSLDAAYLDWKSAQPLDVQRKDLEQKYTWDGFAETVAGQCFER
jgi:glycosyltransferase involved in cell wall biosynthesis